MCAEWTNRFEGIWRCFDKVFNQHNGRYILRTETATNRTHTSCLNPYYNGRYILSLRFSIC